MNAFYALSYLTDGPDENAQAFINTNACARLDELFAHPSPDVKRPAVLTVGNILVGNDLQTQIMIDHNVIPKLQTLASRPNEAVREEVRNAMSIVQNRPSTQVPVPRKSPRLLRSSLQIARCAEGACNIKLSPIKASGSTYP